MNTPLLDGIKKEASINKLAIGLIQLRQATKYLKFNRIPSSLIKSGMYVDEVKFDNWLQGAGEHERNAYRHMASKGKAAMRKLNRKAAAAGTGRVFYRSRLGYWGSQGLKKFKNVSGRMKSGMGKVFNNGLGKMFSNGLSKVLKMRYGPDILGIVVPLAAYLGVGSIINGIQNRKHKMNKAASLLCELEKEAGFKDIINSARTLGGKILNRAKKLNPLRQVGRATAKGFREELKLSPKTVAIGAVAGLGGLALRDYINNNVTSSMLAKKIRELQGTDG